MTIRIKTFTHLPNQKDLHQVSQKALSHGHRFWSRGTNCLEVQVAPKKVATFILLDGDVYVRPRLRISPASDPVRSGPNFICQACGGQRFSNTHTVVKAGEDQWHAIEYIVCTSCVKSGAIEALRRDHPKWYVRVS